MARNPTLAVVDASVVVKWFKEETFTEEALKIRDDWAQGAISLYAVDLLPYEVMNALRCNPDKTPASLRRAAADLVIYPFRSTSFADMAENITDNALQFGITIYDAAYLTAAQDLGIPAYTADKKLLNKVAGDTLRHISTYNPQKN